MTTPAYELTRLPGSANARRALAGFRQVEEDVFTTGDAKSPGEETFAGIGSRG